MKSKVAFLELTVFPGVYPLASGYMQAMACQEERIKTNFSFEIHSICINEKGFEKKVESVNADVYALSCYVWNMGFVKSYLLKLLARQPEAKIILGGPQVMKKAEKYLRSDNENMIICNGEGEYTFRDYLLELCNEQPDLHKVKGISFYQKNVLITTEAHPRITDLNAIPSPYLEGYFNPALYTWGMLETNRGCPFKCTYCYWGAATNAKVYKTDLERVKREITWLSENRALYFFITDANFGMLQRDVEIAQHIADCKTMNGYPQTVFLSASKNTPERVTEITKILSKAGLISTQPVSLQTMDTNTLESVKRSNIKESSYLALLDDLNESGLSSFIEMIWPLPGETLTSFRNGLAKLCRSGADAFVVHHLLMINNVELDDQRELYEIQVTEDSDPNSEAQVVIGTKDVTPSEYKDGVRLGYHVTSLYSLRALRFVGNYLDAQEIMPFARLLEEFESFCKARVDHPYMQYIENIISISGQTKFSATGGIFHTTLHEYREKFDDFLYEFLSSLDLLRDKYIKFLFELDLLYRPYVYSNTKISNLNYIEEITIERHDTDGYTVEIPDQYQQKICEVLKLKEAPSKARRLKIKHRVGQMPHMISRSHDDNLSYCEAKLHKMGSILPQISVLA